MEILPQNFDFDFEFRDQIFFALYPTHREGKTFPRNHIAFLKHGKKVSSSFSEFVNLF